MEEYIKADEITNYNMVCDSSLITDVEEEVDENINDSSEISPFNPEDISIDTRVFPMDALIRRIQQGTIILNPDFQRQEVWTPEKKSQLIESLMLNIPLPMFYVASDEDGILTVVDGLQRMSTIRDFVLGKEYLDSLNEESGRRNEDLRGYGFKLKNLEFWSDYEGYQFNMLPPKLQNRILETQFQFTIINPGTPEEVKRNIFKRINTGGLPLSSQEIRNAIYAGQATELLNEMSQVESFRNAIGNSVRSIRMEDKELILRFLSFMVRDFDDYRTQTIDKWLGDTMIILNAMPKLDTREFKRMLAARKEETPMHINVLSKENFIEYFDTAMQRCHALFGSHAFRKSYGSQTRRPINRCLFEMWAYIMGRYTDKEFEQLLMHKDMFMYEYEALLDDMEFQFLIQRYSMKAPGLQRRFILLITLTDKYAKQA